MLVDAIAPQPIGHGLNMRTVSARSNNALASAETKGARRALETTEGKPRLSDIYNCTFDVVLAQTAAQRQECFRLRYEVYCVENGYEDPAANPGGMETDAFDEQALHALLVHRQSRHTVGTVRLILPQHSEKDINLPIGNVCNHELFLRDGKILPWAQTAEISRFAVSKNFRKRVGDAPPVGTISASPDIPRRQIYNTSLGLMQAIVSMAKSRNITHVCAVMEPFLLRMLRKLGIYFIPLGPPVHYHGIRQPCYSDLDELLARVWVEKPEVWELITKEGSVWPLNGDIVASLQVV